MIEPANIKPGQFVKVTLGQLAVQKARESLGVREDKPYRNRGKWIDIYTGFLGLVGVPWCAAFVAFKIHQAAKQMGIKSRWPKAPWAASCDAVYRWALRNGLILAKPEPGCVFLVGSPADYTHMGFVERVRGMMCDTLEGNTNDDGSREGYEVCARSRPSAQLTFIKID